MIGLLGQVLVQIPLWFAAFYARDRASPWWYGAQPQVAAGEFMAYCAGYFVQDWLAHFDTTPPLLALHHAGSAFAAFAVVSSSGWLGFWLSTATFLESGSIAIELAEFGLLPMRASYLFNIITSVVPGLWVFPAIASRPPDGWAVYVSLATVIVMISRVNENWPVYVKLGRSKPRD